MRRIISLNSVYLDLFVKRKVQSDRLHRVYYFTLAAQLLRLLWWRQKLQGLHSYFPSFVRHRLGRELARLERDDALNPHSLHEGDTGLRGDIHILNVATATFLMTTADLLHALFQFRDSLFLDLRDNLGVEGALVRQAAFLLSSYLFKHVEIERAVHFVHRRGRSE